MALAGLTVQGWLTWCARVHVGEGLLHLRGREHVDVLDAAGLHDVLEEIVVQSQTRNPLHKLTSPVDVNPVLPLFAWLVDQRLAQ